MAPPHLSRLVLRTKEPRESSVAESDSVPGSSVQHSEHSSVKTNSAKAEGTDVERAKV